MKSRTFLATTVALLCICGSESARAGELTYEWYTVANNAHLIPGTSKFFNSYNQPAVNRDGTVVFRARSRGGQGQGSGQPEHGIYVRHLDDYGPITTVFRRGGSVPQPNNTAYGPGDDPAQFNEFPSVPRIDSGSDTIATRAQSQPVWQYVLDGTETRTGTAGVYANPGGVPTTAASMVGDVPGFDRFQVPIAQVPSGTGFDQFPGSPAVTERTTIVFKGNFAVGGVGKTGIFYRDIARKGGVAPIELIASSYTTIPGKSVSFGSTAPPSAGGKYVVFAGYDDEADPQAGGIYRARLGNKPIVLETVVAIHDPVPGERAARFAGFGEAVSVSNNGRHILFWGTWGEEMRNVLVTCPNEGNAARQAYCLEVTGAGLVKQVPVHQGFFVRDMQLGTTTPVAKTGDGIEDFLYWNFSGRVPGMEGEGDDVEELARWKTATFGAISASGTPSISAFKARASDGRDGLYLRRLLPPRAGELLTLLKTGDSAAVVDPAAPAGAVITALGLERDGFRGGWLAISLGMLAGSEGAVAGASAGLEADTGWGGVYSAHFLDDEEIALY